MPRGSESHGQRRGAVRQPVAIVPRQARLVYSGVARRPVRLGITNVSANGLHVLSRDELRAGDLLELAFDLGGDLHVHARVRRVHHQERVWDAGCAFEGVPGGICEQIVRAIFVKQRVMLRAARGKQ